MGAILQPSAAGFGPEFLKFLSDCRGPTDEKLGIAAVIEEQLEMFRIEPELAEAAADLAGKGIISGRPGPPLISGFVHELEKAGVVEE